MTSPLSLCHKFLFRPTIVRVPTRKPQENFIQSSREDFFQLPFHHSNMGSVLLCLWVSFLTVAKVLCGDHMVHSDIKLNEAGRLNKDSKSPEDSIPVIEIRGEGKPMTAAQIRALEEEAEGRPLDIKVKNTWVPADCPHKAKRKDFVTFHYKGFLEDGKKFDQRY